ncbi:unnamed protein product [Amoebophrya sp. A25]|nr:unnamed protein product [Amoebophrya sp. A25]|eukprot:GSA25T00014519001.1
MTDDIKKNFQQHLNLFPFSTEFSDILTQVQILEDTIHKHTKLQHHTTLSFNIHLLKEKMQLQ